MSSENQQLGRRNLKVSTIWHQNYRKLRTTTLTSNLIPSDLVNRKSEHLNLRECKIGYCEFGIGHRKTNNTISCCCKTTSRPTKSERTWKLCASAQNVACLRTKFRLLSVPQFFSKCVLYRESNIQFFGKSFKFSLIAMEKSHFSDFFVDRFLLNFWVLCSTSSWKIIVAVF